MGAMVGPFSVNMTVAAKVQPPQALLARTLIASFNASVVFVYSESWSVQEPGVCASWLWVLPSLSSSSWSGRAWR